MHLTVCLNGTGFHPAGWRLSAPATLSAAHFRELAALAEAGGFAAALFGLSFFGKGERSSGRVPIVQPDALPLVASLIAHTREIGLGATATLQRAEPYNIARAFGTLDLLSLGRTAWIVELEQRGDSDRSRETECIEVVRKLWDSWEDDAFVVDKPKGWVADSGKVHRIDHAGPHFTVRGPLNVPRPTQGHPVLAMIDPGDAAGRALAAAVADLLIVDCEDADAARRIRQSMRAAAPASRDSDALKVMMNVSVILGSTETEAREKKFKLDGLMAGSEPAGPMPGLQFTGTPEQLADRLAELHAAEACDGFNIIPAVLPDDLQLLADRTLPLLRRRELIPAQWRGNTLRDRLGLRHPRSRYAAATATQG